MLKYGVGNKDTGDASGDVGFYSPPASTLHRPRVIYLDAQSQGDMQRRTHVCRGWSFVVVSVVAVIMCWLRRSPGVKLIAVAFSLRASGALHVDRQLHRAMGRPRSAQPKEQLPTCPPPPQSKR